MVVVSVQAQAALITVPLARLSNSRHALSWRNGRTNGYSMVHLGGSVCTPYPGISNDVMFSHLSYSVNHEALLPIIDVMRENQPLQVALLKQYALGSCLLMFVDHLYQQACKPTNDQTVPNQQWNEIGNVQVLLSTWLKWYTSLSTQVVGICSRPRDFFFSTSADW